MTFTHATCAEMLRQDKSTEWLSIMKAYPEGRPAVDRGADKLL